MYNVYMGLDIDSLKFDDEHIRKKFKTSKSLNSIYRAMQAAEQHKHFEVGQVLVCMENRTGRFLTNKAGAVQKWIVANKMGGSLCLCRKLGLSGRPGKGIDIIAEYDPETYTFQEDPDVADAIILGIEYDPLKMPKMMGKARERAKRYNNNISFLNFLKEKLQGDQWRKEDSIMSLIEDLIMLSPNQKLEVWKMSDENHKERYELTDVVRDKKEIWADCGNKRIIISPWELRSNYSSQFFIEEPKTVKEELNK